MIRIKVLHGILSVLAELQLVMKFVCASDPGNPAQSIIKRVCYPESTKFKTVATAWGCEHESSARIAYINLMESRHTAFSCKESVLVVSVSNPFIARWSCSL